jgi:sulfotransferase
VKQYYFLAGLPRSGSTVLSAILNQNPQVYVTPTSRLMEQLISCREIFHKLPSVIANPNPQQVTNVCRQICNSMWDFRQENIIIDKNRGWGKNINALNVLFEQPPKVIATRRDLPSIMASWLTLLKNDNNHIKSYFIKNNIEYTDENIMKELWFNMVKDCMESLQQCKIDCGENLLIIDYDNLVNSPNIEIEKITKFLNLPNHNYDYNNIQSDTNDDDLSAWGINNLHKIRSSLQKTAKNPKEVLGEYLYNIFIELEKQYNFGE